MGHFAQPAAPFISLRSSAFYLDHVLTRRRTLSTPNRLPVLLLAAVRIDMRIMPRNTLRLGAMRRAPGILAVIRIRTRHIQDIPANYRLELRGAGSPLSCITRKLTWRL
jgi:hypothetical protein